MIPWKDRLYAFLLSRVLGPWLDEESLQLLHQSIEVSLQEGRLILKQIGLNTQKLTEKIGQREWKICQATVGRLDVCLFLEEVSADTVEGDSRYEETSESMFPSLAWRAMALGSAASGGRKIALMAKVTLEGIVVHVEPSNIHDRREAAVAQQAPNDTSTASSETAEESSTSSTFTTAANNMLSSFLEAALAALRLSVQINRLTVRIHTAISNLDHEHSSVVGNEPQISSLSCSTYPWVELRVKSIFYRDAENQSSFSTNQSTSSYQSIGGARQTLSRLTSSADSYSTAMHKSLDLARISVSVGTSSGWETEDSDQPIPSSTASTTMVLLEGITHVRMRVIEYSASSSSSTIKTMEQTNSWPSLQQDVEVFLGQNLHFFVDEASLRAALELVSKFQKQETITQEPKTAHVEIAGEQSVKTPSSSDRSDISRQLKSSTDAVDKLAIEGIMEQYQEARRRAERNEVRGGLLLPDSETMDDGDVLTFDAFFDANDKSFYHYSTMLSKSQAPGNDNEGTASKNFVHTKLRCHLNSASAKIAFQKEKSDEYILATLSDVQLSSSLSSLQSSHTIGVSHFEIEEGRPDLESLGRVRIGSILSFSSIEEDTDDRIHEQLGHDEEILVQAPCISVSATMSCTPVDGPSTKTANSVMVDVDIEPFVLTCPPRVLHNLSFFVSKAFPEKDDDALSPIVSKVEKETCSDLRLCVRASCAHLDVVYPLEDISSSTWSSLFARSGVSLVDNFVVSQSAIGVRVERLLVQMNESSDDVSIEELETSFQHILVYAYLHADTDRNHRLLDLTALTGTASPATFSIAKYLDQTQDTSKRQNRATISFPLAPAISSFKARQEDDDDDDDVSPILSPTKEFRKASRRELHGSEPQPQLLDAISCANKLIDLRIQQVSMDLSVDEIAILAEVLCSQMSPAQTPTDKKASAPLPQEMISFSISMEKVAFAVHGDQDDSSSILHGLPIYSYLFKFDQFSTNLLLEGGLPKHARILVHDVVFHEVEDLLPTDPSDSLRSLSAEERAEVVHSRVAITSRTKMSPLIHRSHLFTPISRESPAILLDVIDATRSDFMERSLHLTLYDLTHRFRYDSEWMKRIRRLVTRLSNTLHHENTTIESAEAKDSPHPGTNGSMTRLFLCMADCNMDYSSPCRWKTPSRSILRVGEVRVSCNMIQPSADLQAVKLSVGDVAVCLCNSRFPYSFEDSKMVDTEIHQMEDVPLAINDRPEDILRKMNSRTVLMVDCLDAILTVNHSQSREVSQAQLLVALSVGEISLFACKDSFSLLMDSIGEFCLEACAMDEESFQNLKRSSEAEETYYDPMAREEDLSEETTRRVHVGDDLKEKSPLRPSIGTSTLDACDVTFLLDGYDWTTIQQDECVAGDIPRGDEQSARWYGKGLSEVLETASFRTGDDDATGLPEKGVGKPFKIITHHFPLQPSSDPLGDGDMGASKYAGADSAPPQVKNRITISDLSLKVRLFDGYDWPECMSDELRSAQRTGRFLIDVNEEIKSKPKKRTDAPVGSPVRPSDRRGVLMAGLLDGEPNAGTFQNLPLPDERGSRMKIQAELCRLARRTDKYVQFSASGVQVRIDSFETSDQHRLDSCLDLKAQDFFLAETISCSKPVKMAGEWFSDIDHPRDSTVGLLTLKMVTWHAETRVGREGNIANDECEAAIMILPLRCFLDQKAIRFMQAFFMSDSVEDDTEDATLPAGLHSIPPPLFRKFIAKPFKLKVNYKPEKLDQNALRNGQIVELLNLSPLESLVLTLQQIEIESVVGFGGVISVLVPSWIEHISSTQLVKFLTNARPFEPITTLGEGFSDMVVLPWEAVKEGGDVQRALRAGASSFGRAVAYEALTLSSEAAELLAYAGAGRHLLPSRPADVPTGVQDTTTHVVESLSRGLQAANTKIVIIPYYEYQRNGTTGLVSSVIKGIPVAITAPASGAAEAISYALIGIRNRLRPDIRREEEVNQRGLWFSG